MQPKTEGLEEQGPSGVPFINDPEKPTSPPLNDADATEPPRQKKTSLTTVNPFNEGGRQWTTIT